MKTLKKVIPYIISTASIALFIVMYKDNFAAAGNILKNIKIVFFLLSIPVFVCGVWVISLRYKLLLSAGKIHQNVSSLFKATLVSMFVNNFIPSFVGGDIAKSYYIKSDTATMGRTFSLSLVDRIVGLLTMFAISLISIPFLKELQIGSAFYIFAIGFAAGIVIILVLNLFVSKDFFVNKIQNWAFLDKFKLRDIVLDLVWIVYSPKILLKTVFCTLVSVLFSSAALWLLAISIGISIPFPVFLMIVPIVAFSSLFPSINGLGIRENLMVLLLRPYTADTVSLSLSILNFFVITIVGFIGGFVLLLSRIKKR